MASMLQTETSTLRIGFGRRDSQTPSAQIVEPSGKVAPNDSKGNLYILLELEGPVEGRGRLIRELLETVRDTYFNSGEDIAAALTAGLRNAHASIQQYNQYHRTDFTAGASCLAVTGREIVLAQGGPTILAVRSKGGLQWFSPLNNEDFVALGGARTPQIEIGRVTPQPNLALVVMSSAWANYLEIPLMAEATAVPRAQAIADQLAGIGIDANQELNLLVVTLLEGSAQTQAHPPARPAAPASAATAAATTPSVIQPSGPPAPPVSRSSEKRLEPPVGEDEAWEVEEDLDEEESEDVWEGAAPVRKPVLPPLRLRLGERLRRGSTAQRPAPKVAEPGPAVVKSQAKTAPRAPSRSIPYVLAIAAALALLVIVVTAVMWFVQGRQRARLFQDYMHGAQVNYDAARSTQDENAARQNLRAAREQLQQAMAFFPEDADLVKMRNQIAELEGRVNHVVPLMAGFDVPLISFNQPGARPTEVFVNGLSVYVLDQGRGVLERYQLDADTGDALAGDSAAETIIQAGQTVENRKVGELAHAVWAPAAGNRTATGPLVLDRNNQLFSSNEGLGPKYVPMALNPDLGFVGGMNYYGGNLYLLDTGKSQLWRYRPSLDDYNIEGGPEPYFSAETNVNLSTVIDSAIDGSVWLLHPNGTILKYFLGLQDALNVDVVEPPFSSAVSIWTNDADAEDPAGRLFVADAASNRVLVFTKQGSLLAQLMPDDHPGILNNLRSMTVDESNGYLYLLTDTALYQVSLPTLGETN